MDHFIAHLCVTKRQEWANILACSVAIFAISVTAHGAPLVIDSPSQGNTFFGSDAAIDGGRLLVGAKQDDTNGADVGQAHLFDVTTGALLHTFDDPTPTTRDLFGKSVALDGEHVLVGAALDDTNGEGVGQAHLFSAVSGALVRTFDDPTPSIGGDQFGTAVALDGNHVLISAIGHQVNGVDVGEVHLFERTSGQLLKTFSDPEPTPLDIFGGVVALDENRVLVGGELLGNLDIPGNDVGQVYLFDAITGDVLHTFDDPTPTTKDNFGGSVALDGNHVLIGARWDDTMGEDIGQAHLFDATTGDLLRTFNDPTPTDRDHFGHSVALNGQYAVIGADLDDTNDRNDGQVHVFDLATGDLLQTIDNPGQRFSGFGLTVAIGGNHLALPLEREDTNGSNNGRVYVFTIPEPASMVILLVGGLAGLSVRRR